MTFEAKAKNGRKAEKSVYIEFGCKYYKNVLLKVLKYFYMQLQFYKYFRKLGCTVQYLNGLITSESVKLHTTHIFSYFKRYSD